MGKIFWICIVFVIYASFVSANNGMCVDYDIGPLASGFTGIAAGSLSTCFKLEGGTGTYCQGVMYGGPVGLYDWGSNVQSIAAGDSHTCFVFSDLSQICIGINSFGQTQGVPAGVLYAAAGGSHTCYVMVDGSVICRGLNSFGQAANHSAYGAEGIAAGWGHTCILLSSGNVDCQGNNFAGQAVDYNGGIASGVAAGYMHTCFLLLNGNVVCQGDPAAYEDYSGGDAIGVAAGYQHTCILLSDGRVHCSGDNSSGQVVDYNDGNAVGIAAGEAHTCFLLNNGDVVCYGDNSNGQASLYSDSPNYAICESDIGGGGGADADGDGIPDVSDNCVTTYNTDQANNDADSMGDVCDNCPTTTNQDQANGDGDTYGNACDNCAYATNQAQTNSDADTYGDACDNCVTTTNQDQADGDSDTVGNVCDNCLSVSNTNQLNNDADTYGNACDNCVTATNQDQADGDSDNVGNVCDNCLSVSNTNQLNSDADTYGNACDNCVTITNQDQADGDSDNVGNVCDNCQSTSNTNQANSDADNLGNACDNCWQVTNNYQNDTADACAGVPKPYSSDPACGDACNLPIYSNFAVDVATSNLFAFTNITHYKNVTLAGTRGKIKFPDDYGVVIRSQNYNNNVIIDDCFISVNSGGLDSSFNATAYLTINNEDGHCGENKIFTAHGFHTSANSIRAVDTICPDCSDIEVAVNYTKFRVFHFSGYAIGTNSRLFINDSAESGWAVNGTNITFFAYYMNRTDNSSISGATCIVKFDDDWGEEFTMAEDGDRYNFTKAGGFAATGDHLWNVTCNKTGWNTLEAEDNATIISEQAAVPEFGKSAMMIALAIAFACLFVLRRR